MPAAAGCAALLDDRELELDLFEASDPEAPHTSAEGRREVRGETDHGSHSGRRVEDRLRQNRLLQIRLREPLERLAVEPQFDSLVARVKVLPEVVRERDVEAGLVIGMTEPAAEVRN